MREYFFTVSDESNKRLDIFLSENLQLSRNAIQKHILDKNVQVNGSYKKSNSKLNKNDEICITIPEPVEVGLIPEDIKITVVYEDDSLLVIDKPRGMVVHPAAGHPSGTLVNALLHHCKGRLSGINGELRPGIVHRIDKDTSGLLVVAKNDFTHQNLSEQMKEHSIKREYQGIVIGIIKEDYGEIDAPIGRHPKDRKKFSVNHKNGKNAFTSFYVIERFKAHTLLKFRLKTGRTHQIRVHLQSLGHPLLGDPLYGPLRQPIKANGQILHAKTLGFIHPEKNIYMEFDSELPSYFTDILKKIN